MGGIKLQKKPFKAKKKTYKNKETYQPPQQQGAFLNIESSVKSILIFTLSIFMLFLIIIPGENLWNSIHSIILNVFGITSIFLPFIIGYISIKIANKKSLDNVKSNILISVLPIMFACSLFYVFSSKLTSNQPPHWLKYIFDCCKTSSISSGPGIIGAFIGALLVWAFGILGARISNILILFICTMIATRTTLIQLFNLLLKPAKTIKNKIEDRKINLSVKNIPEANNYESPDKFSKEKNKGKIINKLFNLPSSNNENTEKSEIEDIAKVTEKFLSKVKNNLATPEENIEDNTKVNNSDFEADISMKQIKDDDNYEFPPLELLNKSINPKEDDISSELNNNGTLLVNTLKSFNVQTKIVDISRGPAVTRYELQPAAGVKISKITTLADDIALNLAAAGVRIEAPIPGKAAVGVEIPNKFISIVNMRELIMSNAFKSSKSKLTVVLGKDISGEVVVADLAKMPHLLIAGATGSGKSVCINSFIISILYNARPNEVKLLMIDPKVVELGIYNGIPHLLVPVVTDARKAAGALGWAVTEMLNRYKRFAENNVRDIFSYNDLVSQHLNEPNNENKFEKMPQIVIVIDELSDLMMAAPNEVEDYICRLAQMARAAGMYLVIATQRPSVDVITGIIKANIPSRIALSVSSQIDSRTILDMSGAEKLLGRGDMLFAPSGCSKPIRIQGCYVTDKEIEKIISFVKKSQESEYDDKISQEIEKNSIRDNSKSKDEKLDGDSDPVMKEAIKCVIEAGQASTSLLQRRLRLGYARAGRLIDEMEQMGIVGPHEGSKPRQVLMNYQQFLEMNMNREDL